MDLKDLKSRAYELIRTIEVSKRELNKVETEIIRLEEESKPKE